MRTHEVKSWPEFFIPVNDGVKPFDLRRNDRDYQVGDLLRMREWVPKNAPPAAPEPASNRVEPAVPVHALGTYSGREVTKRLTWILEGIGHVGAIEPLKGLNRGYVILGLAPPKRECHRGTGDPPQECDWPHCWCDEKAVEVLNALEEQGLVPVRTDLIQRVIAAMDSRSELLAALRKAVGP